MCEIVRIGGSKIGGSKVGTGRMWRRRVRVDDHREMVMGTTGGGVGRRRIAWTSSRGCLSECSARKCDWRWTKGRNYLLRAAALGFRSTQRASA